MTKLFSAVVLLVGDHRHRPCAQLSLPHQASVELQSEEVLIPGP